MKTKVIFRHFQGEVVALFPEVAATVGMPWHCQSYAHIGQHSGADAAGVIRHSRPAKPSEYKPLAAELRKIGYRLKIVKRCTRKDYECRARQCD